MGWSEDYRDGYKKGSNSGLDLHRDGAGNRDAFIAGEWKSWRDQQKRPSQSNSFGSSSSSESALSSISFGSSRPGSGKITSFIFLITVLYGVYDSLANQTSAFGSAEKAAFTTFGLAATAGSKIQQIDPSSDALSWVGLGVKWGVGLPFGLVAGLGAGVGGGAVWVAKAVLGARAPEQPASSAQAASGVAGSASPSPRNTVQPHYAKVTAINLNLRNSPAVDPDNVITTMPQGLRVKVVGRTENGWLELDEIPGSGDAAGQKFHGYASVKGGLAEEP